MVLVDYIGIFFLHFRILLTDDCVVCIYRVKSNIDFPLQVTIFFLFNSRLFFNIKIYSTLQKLNGQISNMVLNYFFPREVRDKNKESSIYTQNS